MQYMMRSLLCDSRLLSRVTSLTPSATELWVGLPAVSWPTVITRCQLTDGNYPLSADRW